MGTIFTIITSIGVEIQSYSSIAGEKEVLLPPGMTFVVKSRVLNAGGFNHITIEHVNSVPILIV